MGEQERGWFAAPFSGGAWYDPADRLFKMWYAGGFLASTCYATSKDGIYWEKPGLDAVEDRTNIVLVAGKPGRIRVDTTTIWLDQNTRDSKARYKYFATERGKGSRTSWTGWYGKPSASAPRAASPATSRASRRWADPLAHRTDSGYKRAMSKLDTAFTDQVGVSIPIIGGAMYPCSNPELVAAVSAAGGIGVIQPLSIVYAHGLRFISVRLSQEEHAP